jgi:hypothetical protein
VTKLYPESCDSFEVPITVTLYGPVCLWLGNMWSDGHFTNFGRNCYVCFQGRRGNSSVIFSALNREAVGANFCRLCGFMCQRT